jgi:hypothetical protein
MQATIASEGVSSVKVTHSELLFPGQQHRSSTLRQSSPRKATQTTAVFKQGMSDQPPRLRSELPLYHLSAGLPCCPSSRPLLLQALVITMPRSKTDKSSSRPRTNPFAEVPPHPTTEGIRSRSGPVIIDIDDVRTEAGDWAPRMYTAGPTLRSYAVNRHPNDVPTGPFRGHVDRQPSSSTLAGSANGIHYEYVLASYADSDTLLLLTPKPQPPPFTYDQSCPAGP